MSDKKLTEFEYACRDFLAAQSIGNLRSYGRQVGVKNPTTKKKGELIDLTVKVLTGELKPCFPNGRGAPIKDDYVDPKIPEEIERLKLLYLSEKTQENTETNKVDEKSYNDYLDLKFYQDRKKVYLEAADPNPGRIESEGGQRAVYRGQLETLNNIPMLLSLTGKDTIEKIIMPVELIRTYDLQEGDIVSCYAERRHSVLVATEVLTINDVLAASLKRNRFENSVACYPHQRINVFEENTSASLTSKYIQWLLPLGKGQRGLVISSPKAGKTTILADIAQSAKKLNRNLNVLGLLIDQSPETISQFQKILEEGNLLYTTYEDDPERQVFLANFLLKRAQRLAECGQDVLLIVDSINALARAFNDTNASLGGRRLDCGLESKTVQYMKRYFGAGRCLEKGGSITILGAVSVDTGNPMDELIGAEISLLANFEVRLNNEMAIKRLYPAIDFFRSNVKQAELLQTAEENEVERQLRSLYFEKVSLEKLLVAVSDSRNMKELLERL